MSFMNITFEMIYHVVSAYMDAIGILLVPIGMAIVGLFYLIYIFGWLNMMKHSNSICLMTSIPHRPDICTGGLLQ